MVVQTIMEEVEVEEEVTEVDILMTTKGIIITTIEIIIIIKGNLRMREVVEEDHLTMNLIITVIRIGGHQFMNKITLICIQDKTERR